MQRHKFHLVTRSPWPFLTSLSVLGFLVNVVTYIHFGSDWDLQKLIVSLFILLTFMFSWWTDVVREATFIGDHTRIVQKNIMYGMILFIVSEVMFFFSFFWAFFHSSVAPVVEIGCVWPPVGIECVDPRKFPLIGTLLLISSGFSVTLAHDEMCEVTARKKNRWMYTFFRNLKKGSRLVDVWSFILQAAPENTDFSKCQYYVDYYLRTKIKFLYWLFRGRRLVRISLIVTILFSFCFLACQYEEYSTAPFTIADGIYGTTFYMTTGFHGFHVIIGTIFLIVCLFRVRHFTSNHHVGLITAAWYWHFVDVVWILLYILMYWWGSALII